MSAVAGTMHSVYPDHLLHPPFTGADPSVVVVVFSSVGFADNNAVVVVMDTKVVTLWVVAATVTTAVLTEAAIAVVEEVLLELIGVGPATAPPLAHAVTLQLYCPASQLHADSGPSHHVALCKCSSLRLSQLNRIADHKVARIHQVKT